MWRRWLRALRGLLVRDAPRPALPFDFRGPDMSVYDLYRMSEGPGYTMGRIEDAEHHQLCTTVERAWVDKDKNGLGDKGESRIPAGTYICRRDQHGKSSSSPYEVWEICDVPGRSEIHIHVGNRATESQGCVLVGTGYGAQGAVTESKKAFAKWMQVTAGFNQITLRVHDVPPKAA